MISASGSQDIHATLALRKMRRWDYMTGHICMTSYED